MWCATENIMAALQRCGGPAAALYEQAMLTGVQLTTSYSGIGTVEVAAGMLSDGFRQGCASYGRWSGIGCYSACDVDEDCQKALCAHQRDERDVSECSHGLPWPKGPSHVFGDLLSRMDVESQKAIHSLTTATFAKESGRSSSDIVPARSGDEFFQRVCQVLEKAHWLTVGHCKRHETSCKFVPSRQDGGSIHMEFAGLTCVAWSQMNTGAARQWFHPSAAPAIAHAFWTRWARPSIVCIECVIAFDAVSYFNILCEDGLYFWHQLEVSPEQCGIPTRRMRQFNVAYCRAEFVEGSALRRNEVFVRSFSSAFYRKVVTTAALYMVASQARLAEEKKELAKERGFCLHDDAAVALPFRSLIPGAQKERQEAYMRTYKAIKEEDNAPDLEACWVDLSQTAGYFTTLRDICPVVLRNSNFYDLMRKRPIMLEEKFIAMGFAVCGMNDTVDHWASKHWPFAWEAGRASMPKQGHQMIGNGIHVYVAAAILAHALSAAACSDAQAAKYNGIAVDFESTVTESCGDLV
eukprot:6480128-Amphidinium_carterae.3